MPSCVAGCSCCSLCCLCPHMSLCQEQGSERLNVSIVNRGDDKGRHFTNEQETRKLIMHEFSADVDQVRCARPHALAPRSALPTLLPLKRHGRERTRRGLSCCLAVKAPQGACTVLSQLHKRHALLPVLCRIVRPDEMSFAEQIRAYATSSIVITTHSAATANLMFIPEVGSSRAYGLAGATRVFWSRHVT